MRYMMLLSHWEAPAGMTAAERDRLLAEVGRWWSENQAGGAIVDGKQFQPPTNATTVVIADGRSTLIDGPYPESKDVIGGYGILEVPDQTAAVALARTWPLPGSRIELRPIAAT